jgi:hypothetical protein
MVISKDQVQKANSFPTKTRAKAESSKPEQQRPEKQ